MKIRMNKVQDRGSVLGYANVVIEGSDGHAIALRGLKVIKTTDDELIVRSPYNQFKKGDEDVRAPYFRVGTEIADAVIKEFTAFLDEDSQFKDCDVDISLDGATVEVNSLIFDEEHGGRLDGVFSIKFLNDDNLLFEMREILKVQTQSGNKLFSFPSYLKDKDGEKTRYNIHFPMNQLTREFLISQMNENL